MHVVVAPALAASALLWAACAAAAPLASENVLPAPDPAASAAVQQQDYRIGPLDTLEITVFKVDDLNRTLQVDAAGQINFPLIGAVEAAARTPAEVARHIEARLGERYLQAPQVTVFVKQSQSQKFTVEGAVERPGVYDVHGRMTLLQAIATAQGVNETANLKNVVIFRTIDERRRAAVVNLADVRTGRVPDPQIYASDIIVVSNSGSRQFLRSLIGATPLFSIFTGLGF